MHGGKASGAGHGATQGTAEPTGEGGESAVVLASRESSTQESEEQPDAKKPALAPTPKEKESPLAHHHRKAKTTGLHYSEEQTQAEKTTREPDEEKKKPEPPVPSAKPAAVEHKSAPGKPAAPSKPRAPSKKSKKEAISRTSKKRVVSGKRHTKETDTTERVGVIGQKHSTEKESKESKQEKESRKRGASRPRGVSVTQPSAEQPSAEKEKASAVAVEEKVANCTSQATKREKKANNTTTQDNTTQRKVSMTHESDRTQTQALNSSSKAGKSGTDTLGDYYQRRRKQQIAKAKTVLCRNKQLVEIPVQRGEMNDQKIEDKMYYHGYLWRGDLPRMITEEGQFLVRKSDWKQHSRECKFVESKGKHDCRADCRNEEVFVISVMAQDSIINLLIKQTNTKKLYWVFNYAFRTVVELIDYHYRNNEPVDEDSVYLRIPVFRQDWQYSHEQCEAVRQLGSGNFGTVHAGYLKRDPFDPPVKVAIKTLTIGNEENGKSMTASDKNEFLKEANLMLAVDHPNLVKLFGLAATRMPIQIIMELCDDTLLGKLKVHFHAWLYDRKEGMMTSVEKARYVLDAARGLEYLHSCFIIHRDIAARNVLIRDGQAKISDFGLSIVGGMKEVKKNNLPTRWCAPETLAQGMFSFHTDVFSFGALIYEVFSFGRQPYDYVFAQKPGALRSLIIYGGQAGCNLDPIDPTTPIWIKEMIDRCRQRDCYARPLMPEVVKKLETQLGSKAPSVGFWVSVRERFQRFIVDMLSIADYASKEEEYIKADLDWLSMHTVYEQLEADEKEHSKAFPYLPNNKKRLREMVEAMRAAAAAPAADAAAAAVIPAEPTAAVPQPQPQKQ